MGTERETYGAVTRTEGPWKCRNMRTWGKKLQGQQRTHKHTDARDYAKLMNIKLTLIGTCTGASFGRICSTSCMIWLFNRLEMCYMNIPCALPGSEYKQTKLFIDAVHVKRVNKDCEIHAKCTALLSSDHLLEGCRHRKRTEMIYVLAHWFESQLSWNTHVIHVFLDTVTYTSKKCNFSGVE